MNHNPVAPPSSGVMPTLLTGRAFHFIAIAIVAVIGIFYSITLYEGHDWSGDFSQYIHHAKNLVDGKHYLDTGYIVSSSAKFVGPYAYPPVFPILLAPVYWLNGLDFEAMKLVAIVSLCLSLLLLPRIFNDQLSRPQQITLILLVGANPFFWEYRNNILSDYTFILFSYLSLRLMQQFLQPADTTQLQSYQRTVWRSFGLGLIMYLAYGCREIGIILPLCVLTYEIVNKRKISLIAIGSVFIFLVLACSQYRFLNADLTPISIQQNLAEFSEKYAESSATGHLDFISLDPDAIMHRVQGYRWALQAFLPFNHNPTFEVINTVLFNLVTLLAFFGYFIALKRKITVLEIFFAGYVAVLLIFGAPTYTRYLLPLFPLTLYYAIISYQSLLSSGIFASNRYHLKRVISAGLLSIASVSYAYSIKSHSYDALDNGIGHPKVVEMFAFIRNNAALTDTIVTIKPRMMSLLTGRTSIGTPRLASPSSEQINQFFDAAEADYYVDFKLQKWILPLSESTPPTPEFTEVFRNSHVAIYKYQPPT